MSLTFIRTEPAHYALFHGREEVGWLSRRAIGICGFASAGEARSAGEAASRALARWLDTRRTMDGQLLPSSRNAEGSPRDEEDHFGVPPPVHVTRRCGPPRSFGFEILLPPDTLFAIAVHAVQVLHGALQSPAISHVTTRAGADVGSAA